MKKKKLWLILSLAFVISSCNLGFDQTREFSQVEARELIQRNIFREDDTFPIDDPRVYQYGTVHIDGPSGGMLYRFWSSPDALEWIGEQHHLQQVKINAGDQLPLQFLDDIPRWWQPEKNNPASYYVFQEEFSTGGKRQLIVVFDVQTNDIYMVEHFSDMPGI